MNRGVKLILGGLAAAYAINVAINAAYQETAGERIEMLGQRAEELARIDPEGDGVAALGHWVEKTRYASFLTAASSAFARGEAATAYLRGHPHLSLGIAVDGDGLSADRLVRLLAALNQTLAPHGVTVGLSEPVATIALPRQSTWEDMLQGVTTSFAGQPDYHLVLTSKHCREAGGAVDPAAPVRNRFYSFGRKGLSLIDAARLDRDLAERLRLDLARHLAEETVKGRWRAADYAENADAVLARRSLPGRIKRKPRVPERQAGVRRTLDVTVGLDAVDKAQARAAFDGLNRVYAPFGLQFRIRQLYRHPLDEQWRWPNEIRILHARGDADILVLLSSGEWISPLSGHVRGLASAFVGALMVQTGTAEETRKRLTHEVGHLFGLRHSFLAGHVMYPNEGGIGRRWAPGNDRLMREGRLDTTWHRKIIDRHLFDRSIALAPTLRRWRSGIPASSTLSPSARGEAWIRCEA